MLRYRILWAGCSSLVAWVAMSAPAEGATVSATSCERAAVVTAINSAASPDTVAVPAGTCAWSTPVTLPSSKDLTVLGAGIDRTVLTCSTMCFVVPNTATTRISGFTFDESEVIYRGPAAAGKSFRLDHNKFSARSRWRVIDISGESPARHPTGVIDHNEFLNYGVHVNGTNMSFVDGPEQQQLWAENRVAG